MSRKVRGHTATTRRTLQNNNEVQTKAAATAKRPQTSLGFDRDSPEFASFLAEDLKPRRLQQVSESPKDGILSRSPRATRRVAPLSKALERFTKQEERWQMIRDTPMNDAPTRSNYGHKVKSGTERTQPRASHVPALTDSINPKGSPKNRPSSSLGAHKTSPQTRRVTKAWSAPDGFKKSKSKVASRSLDKIVVEPGKDSGKKFSGNKGPRNGTSSAVAQLSGRNSLLSVEPLKSIIETEDNERYIEGQDHDEISQLVNSMSHVSVDDIMLDDADENYDTDLEEDFPAPPPKEYDPSERQTYVESCLSQGLIPVSYVVKRLGNRSLVMRHHGLGPHGIRPLANALVKNTCIEELDLTDNDIQADGGIFLSFTLYENLYITDLNLSDNFLRVEGGISLAKVLLTNTSLKKLTLQGNHFTDKVAKAFAEVFKDNRTLQHLDLSYNEFGELGGLFLGAGLGLNYGLKMLNLSWNSIRNKGAVSLAASLKTNESLTHLNLSWNGLAFVGALAFARHLKKNEALADLDISNNRIGPKGAQRLSLALKVNSSLRYFRIGLNPIGDEGVHAILNAAKKNTNIRFLGLEDITVSPKIHEEILRLESERDIVIRTGGKTGHAQEAPLPSGMEILVQFIQDNRMRLKDLFFQFDKDHSGDISRDEFKAGLKETGIQMSEKQLDALIESIDIDNSNTIEYSEIIYGREAVMKERRFQHKVAIRTEQREKESIQLPKLKGFEE